MNFKELKDMLTISIGSDVLVSQMDTIIALAEADIANELIHVPQLLTSATLTTSNQYNTVAGIHLVKAVFINGDVIQYRSIVPKGVSVGEVAYYSIEGRDTIKFDVKPDREITLEVIYFPILSPLLLGLTVADTDTNWLLNNAPNVYLYGCLAVATTLLNSEEAVKWSTLYKTSIKEYKRNLAIAGGIYVME